MNIEQIEARKAEILELMTAEDANLDALEEEMRSLNAQIEELKAQAEAEAEERKKAASNGIEVKSFTEKEEDKMEERTFGIESMEYRNAWLKTLQHKELNEVEARAYATTDSNTAIPTLVADKFFEKMKKVAPMLDEITLFQVKGSLKVVAEGTNNAAAKHTENSAATAAADTILSVTLGSQEFIKVIGISKNAEAMSIDAFEGWLVDMLARDIGRAIDDYIINDSSNGLVKAGTWTTGTNQILNTATTGYTYKNVVDLIALLPAAYDAEAKFLVNKATLYGQIANITNSAGNPIFVEHPEAGMTGRILGYPVVVDDYVTTANNALYLGKYTDIVGNFATPIEVERDASAGFTSATIMYRGYAGFDSKPTKNDAFVRLVATV